MRQLELVIRLFRYQRQHFHVLNRFAHHRVWHRFEYESSLLQLGLHDKHVFDKFEHFLRAEQ